MRREGGSGGNDVFGVLAVRLGGAGDGYGGIIVAAGAMVAVADGQLVNWSVLMCHKVA